MANRMPWVESNSIAGSNTFADTDVCQCDMSTGRVLLSSHRVSQMMGELFALKNQAGSQGFIALAKCNDGAQAQ